MKIIGIIEFTALKVLYRFGFVVNKNILMFPRQKNLIYRDIYDNTDQYQQYQVDFLFLIIHVKDTNWVAFGPIILNKGAFTMHGNF